VVSYATIKAQFKNGAVALSGASGVSGYMIRAARHGELSTFPKAI